MGDMHYQDIALNDENIFKDAYRRIHSESNQVALYRSTSLAYIWDDHDFGPNDSDGT